MRKLLPLLVLVALLAGGCAQKISEPKPEAVVVPRPTGDAGSASKDVGVPPTAVAPTSNACVQTTPPTREEMTNLLARVSTYAPLENLTGPALAIEKQWLSLQDHGWPEESHTWASNAWFALDVVKGVDGAYLVYLKHGQEVRRNDRFMVVCNNGRWQVKQFARNLDGPWLEPASEIPGQRGDLTPALVSELVKVAANANGPWFAQVATGNALAWKRVEELRVARGRKAYPSPWRPNQQWQVQLLDSFHAEAKTTQGGAPIRLSKADGLWKIENYTEGGQWLAPPTADRISDLGVLFDPPMGVLLGVTDQKTIQERFGVPDETKKTDTGEIYRYHGRKIEIQFDLKGKVSRFSMRTGALNSGVRIGSPISHWELIYGPKDEGIATSNQHLSYVARDGRVEEITISNQ